MAVKRCLSTIWRGATPYRNTTSVQRAFYRTLIKRFLVAHNNPKLLTKLLPKNYGTVFAKTHKINRIVKIIESRSNTIFNRLSDPVPTAITVEGDETCASSMLVDASWFMVEHLNANKYFLWSRKLEIILKGKGLRNELLETNSYSEKKMKDPRLLSTEEKIWH